MSTGLLAAFAVSCTWQERSIVMNHHAAASTVSPHGQQPVIAQDHRLVRPEGGRDAPPLLLVHDDARVVVEERVVLVEGTDVLRDRLQQLPERGQSPPVGGVAVGGGHDVGAGLVDLRVDREGGLVDVVAAFGDLALVVDQDQIGDGDVLERHPEGIDPEVIRELRVTRGDVPRDAFLEAEPPEEPQSGREPLLTVPPLVRNGVVLGRHGEVKLIGGYGLGGGGLRFGLRHGGLLRMIRPWLLRGYGRKLPPGTGRGQGYAPCGKQKRHRRRSNE
ncbi:hypothetical protein GCM10020000_32420 [Streptomyces olivoverticillatus]